MIARVLMLMPWVLPSHSQYHIERVDPLAFLTTPLHTFHAMARDGEVMSMECPPDTQVAIQHVSYSPANTSPAHPCSVQEAVRTVEALCQGRNLCLVTVEPGTFVLEFQDPCPAQR